MNDISEEYKPSSGEAIEIDKIVSEISGYVLSKLKHDETYKNWYVGITGQKDKDADRKIDRINAHKIKYDELEVDTTWREFTTSNAEVSKMAERRLGEMGFDIGNGVREGSLNPTVIYTFRKSKI